MVKSQKNYYKIVEHWNTKEKGNIMDSKEEFIIFYFDGNSSDEVKEINPYLKDLENTSFGKFYINNPKEQKYLFSKIEDKDLSQFATKEFSLADILQCMYIKAYIIKKGINKDAFEKNVIAYADVMDKDFEGSDEDKIKKFSVQYIEENRKEEVVYDSKGNPVIKKELMDYVNFRDIKKEYLFEILDYVFDEDNAKEKFKDKDKGKGDKYYKFNSIEAMFIFFILDDINKEETQKIRLEKKMHLIERKFMKTFRRYAIGIANNRDSISDVNTIEKIYKERIDALKSDLPAICKMLIEVENKLEKEEKVDFIEILKTLKSAKKKLKKFIKRYKKKYINDNKTDKNYEFKKIAKIFRKLKKKLKKFNERQKTNI